ncbi:hypothetical protein [Streptomyces sp. NPDC056361]|uniref:hypothetical protein n=1 Tax=Streptomyces sp. NPDC056361 TaxID=3345795 RepID=UPI0035E0E5A8
MSKAPKAAQSSQLTDPGGSVDVAPELAEGTVVAAVAKVKGNRAVPLEGGVRKGPLGIMVSCKGAGTVKVALDSSGFAFPVKCGAGEVSTIYNRIDLTDDRAEAYVQVEAPGSVSWAMSVGRL